MAKQGAYRLSVGIDSLGVALGRNTYWTSPRTASSYNLATYAGKPLQRYTKYYWRVEVWNEAGALIAKSGVASFETGVMDKKNWKGTWISDNGDVQLKPC